MSFPRYEKYKRSGIESLGDVPEHWKVVPFRSAIMFQEGPGIMTADFFEVGIPLLRISGVQGRWVSLDGCNYLNAEKVATRWKHFRVQLGDLIISASASMGTVTEVGPEAVGAIPYTGLIRLMPKKDFTTKDYIRAIVVSSLFTTQIDLLKAGATIQHFGPTHLSQIKISLPPLSEQIAIAAFLDREMAKIDELVAEQQRLIELLKEKRQAVISHAVIRGLNPNVKLKPSGIEWLGDVPEHWEIRKISQLFRAGKGKNGQLLTKEFCADNEGIYPVYSGQTENEGIMGYWKRFEFDFGENGVLFSTTVGAKAMDLRQLFGRFSLSQNCMIIWTTSNLCKTRFFYYHFQPLFKWQRSLIPDHMQPSFRMEDLYSFIIVLPPLPEQTAIVEFLDRETAKVDTLIIEARRTIDLLQERRTSLISAAVTGKIDVHQLNKN